METRARVRIMVRILKEGYLGKQFPFFVSPILIASTIFAFLNGCD